MRYCLPSPKASVRLSTLATGKWIQRSSCADSLFHSCGELKLTADSAPRKDGQLIGRVERGPRLPIPGYINCHSVTKLASLAVLAIRLTSNRLAQAFDHAYIRCLSQVFDRGQNKERQLSTFRLSSPLSASFSSISQLASEQSFSSSRVN